MANPLLITILILFSTILVSTAARHITLDHDSWLETLNPTEEEKFTKLHFYIHDFVSGPNQTVYNVAESSITSESGSWFGRVQVVDHLITTGPDIGSEKVGRVQGVHVLSDLHVAAITVNWNFLFEDGSTILVLGRLVAFAKEGELAIVGGTGKYLMARGVAYKTTLRMDPDTLNSIMEYTMYVYSSPGAFSEV
ncbi:disease resistance-responsive (dirigent-likeprotein) family protein [Striga asiatica]|uniref:Dirigent protein n=1 Tax=Striga asiatica TaxID=4170 RepID=A0A5A7R0I2_STRAF|nr:disease resistance-responsive (dirigent-likeprotein) family protein [Striga asiatica]